MAESYNPADVWPPFGAFSMAVVQGEGPILHLKGQVPLDRAGDLVGRDDMQAQVRQVLSNIETVLAGFGGRMSDVISLTHYTTDIAAFMQAGTVRAAYFREPYPVTTTVEVRRLYDPEIMIEITAVAEIPLARFRRPPGGHSMHL